MCGLGGWGWVVDWRVGLHRQRAWPPLPPAPHLGALPRPALTILPFFPSSCPLQHGWEVANGRVIFKPAAGDDQEAAAAAAAALPSLEIISHCLNYAREVERIV